MRVRLNDNSAAILLELMQLKGFTSANHTLNVILTETLESMKNPQIEVDNNGNTEGETLHKVQ